MGVEIHDTNSEPGLGGPSQLHKTKFDFVVVLVGLWLSLYTKSILDIRSWSLACDELF